MAKKTVCVLGAPTASGNRGVIALGASVAALCTGADNDRDIIFLSGQSTAKPLEGMAGGERRSFRTVNYRLSPKSGLNTWLPWIVMLAVLYKLLPPFRKAIAGSCPWIGAMASSEWVGDIRGGDSFSDIYGMKRFCYGFLAAWTAILVKGSLVQFPQTYGPYKNPLAKRMARFLLLRSPLVIARDEDSRSVAVGLVGDKVPVHLSPDVAFALEVGDPGEIALTPGNDSGELIGINVNGLMLNGGYTRSNMFGLKLDYSEFLQEMITRLLAESEATIWLVPHTYAPHGDVESDDEACFTVRDQLPKDLQNRVRVVDAEYDQHEIKGVIGKTGFFIGSRMHSCIAALSQGIPCVGLAYSMKFRGVFASVGMGEWVVDGREYTTSGAVEEIVKLYHERESKRAPLGEEARQARGRLAEVFAKVVAPR